MTFQDNAVKTYLKNVYFITGTPCGGKTTISRELAKRHSVVVYDVDAQFPKHRQLSSPEFQPFMNRQFRDADEFFGRTVREYKQWLLGSTREQLDFIILDLIRLSQNQTVLCDCHLTVEEASRLTEPWRIVFLLRDPRNLADDYCNRPDHEDFRNFVYSASNPAKAKDLYSETLKSINLERIAAIKSSPYFWLERDGSSTVEETVQKVEQHFSWNKKLGGELHD